jgi:putative ubiquitin-RnfH superfamily antitoxin RatB of RatAB toxin-antitoxin module
MSAAPIRIEIAYAEPHRAIVKALSLAAGSCIADALRVAALDPDFSGVDLVNSPLGVFGRAAGHEYLLKEGDRIEIYRPLAADPKAARRSRVQQARKKSARQC